MISIRFIISWRLAAGPPAGSAPLLRMLWRGLALLGIAATTVTADVLDDLGVTERQFAMGFRATSYARGGTAFREVIGLPISAEHEAAIAAELGKLRGVPVWRFYESRGDFAGALAADGLAPLDRVRLLVRANRRDEARAALDDGLVGRLAEEPASAGLLLTACQPLEDAQAWEELRELLGLLAERLTSVPWRAALWAEELDLAWHVDQVPALLAERAGDPLRLAVYHHRLGNRDERDRLAAGLLENGTPERLPDLLGLLPNCPLVREAALKQWQREDLGTEARAALLAQLLLLRPTEQVEEAIRAWLANGGDAMPMADPIWRRWWVSPADTVQRAAVLAALHQRHPAEPRFRLLLGRQCMKSDPSRAAALFESVARLPFVANPEASPRIWLISELAHPTAEVSGNLPFLAIRGLGSLDRQDRVRVVLDAQPGWAQFSAADQVRYLAAGEMDFAVVKTTLAADFSKPENDGLANWLAAVLEARLRSRQLPGEVAGEIAARFDMLVAGSAEKGSHLVVADAAALLGTLAGTEAEAGVLRASVRRLTATVGKRNGEQVAALNERLRDVALRNPRLQPLFPDLEDPRPAPPEDEDLSKGLALFNWLVLCAPPQLRRIAPEEKGGWMSQRRLDGPFSMGRYLDMPLELLDHWPESSGRGYFGMRRPGMPANAEEQRIIRSLMGCFRSEDSRRLVLEILVAKNIVDGGDPVLAAEARASLAAVMAGTRKERGTEAFRYATLVQQRVGEAKLREMLGELKSLPLSARENFLQRLQRGWPGTSNGLQLARRELVPELPTPGRTPVRPDEDSGRLRDMVQRNLAAEPRALAYAREILALDPADAGAAGQLVGAAVAEGNRDLLLTCVRAMGADGLSRLARNDVLGPIFSKDDAPEVLTLVREQNLAGRMPDAGAVTALHPYFLAADPDLATEFRRWLSGCGKALEINRRQLAGQLLDAGRRDEAVELIAGAYLTPPEYPGFPHRFPPKPGTGSRPEYYNFDPAGLVPDLEFLLQRKLLEAVIDRIGAPAAADPQVLATFRMVAAPEPATFERHVAPTLGNMGESPRQGAIRKWIDFFMKQPAASPLVLRLLKELSKSESHQKSRLDTSMIELAASLPGGARVIASEWTRLGGIADGLTDPVEKTAATQSMVRLLRAMLNSADDKTWQDYWRWREGVVAPLGQLDYSPYGSFEKSPPGAPPFSYIDPSRLRQVMPRVLQDAGAKLPATQAKGWVLAAVATGEPSLLEKTKVLVPPGCGEAAELCDLGLGDPMAVAPVLGATPEPNGETLLWWNFVTCAPVDRKGGGLDIPQCPFPALDGKFDLLLTAGSRPDRLVVVEKLSAVAAAGHVRLKLEPHLRYVAMVATEETTGVLRWSRVIDLQGDGEMPLPIPDAELRLRGFERFGWDGPGGLPAWKTRFSARDRVDLLECPWTGRDPLTVSAWVSGDGKLELRCMDAAGRELTTLVLKAWDAPQPVWQFRRISVPDQDQIPDGTVRLVLAAAADGHNDGPRNFLISNVSISGTEEWSLR